MKPRAIESDYIFRNVGETAPQQTHPSLFQSILGLYELCLQRVTVPCQGIGYTHDISKNNVSNILPPPLYSIFVTY